MKLILNMQTLMKIRHLACATRLARLATRKGFYILIGQQHCMQCKLRFPFPMLCTKVRACYRSSLCFMSTLGGLPFTCPLIGASLIFAGPFLDGPSLFKLMDNEQATSAWGVPTVLTTLLEEIKHKKRVPTGLNNILVGGSAISPGFIEDYENLGITVNHAWA